MVGIGATTGCSTINTGIRTYLTRLMGRTTLKRLVKNLETSSPPEAISAIWSGAQSLRANRLHLRVAPFRRPTIYTKK